MIIGLMKKERIFENNNHFDPFNDHKTHNDK